MTKTAITAHAVTIIGALLTFLGVQGIDASTVSSLVQGVSAVVTVVAAIVAAIEHTKTVSTVKA